jgi:putative transposase
LGCCNKKDLIDPKHKKISITRQCSLLNYNRSNVYYKPTVNISKLAILKAIDEIYTQYPFYGHRKVHQMLLDDGFNIGRDSVRNHMNELGLKVIYPTKKVKTTIANIEHHKYPYLLRGMEITYANQVWSTDITYIRLDGGFVYLAAIIDWYSKAILAYKISNTMDSHFVTSVLKNAIAKHGTPEIFNTDQGSQYTSKNHTDILSEHNIQISMDGKGRATDNIAIERF